MTCARECGFRKLFSALVKDLYKAQADMIEIIAMAADDELGDGLQADYQRPQGLN